MNTISPYPHYIKRQPALQKAGHSQRTGHSAGETPNPLFISQTWQPQGTGRILDLKDNFKKLAQQRYEAVKSALTEDLPVTQKPINYTLNTLESPSQAVLLLQKAVSKIVHSLEKLEGKDVSHEEMQDLRRLVDEALGSKAYQTCKEEKNSDAQALVQFLQLVSYKFNTQAAGMNVLREVGKKATNVYCTDTQNSGSTSTKFVENLKGIFTKIPAHHKENLQHTLYWAVSHPHRAFSAAIDNLIPDGHKLYNSYEIGNANTWVGDFVIGSKKVRFNLGPSPAHDQLFQASLEWQHLNGTQHIQHALEFNHAQGEKGRLTYQKTLSDAHENLHVMATALDGEIWDAQGDFGIINILKEFMTQLIQYFEGLFKFPEEMKDYKGFVFPETLFPGKEKDVNGALKSSIDAIESLLVDAQGNPIDISQLNDEERKQLNRTVILNFTGFLVLKALINFGNPPSSQEKEELVREVLSQVDACFGESCKQDIDRGAIVNAMLIGYMDLINYGHLKEATTQEMTGILLSRALMVDDRIILKNRLDALMDLFHFIGKNEGEFVRQLRTFVGYEEGQPSPISFISSDRVINENSQNEESSYEADDESPEELFPYI